MSERRGAVDEVALQEFLTTDAERLRRYITSRIPPDLRAVASPDDLLQEVVSLAPLAWQYPEDACARVVLNGRAFQSERFVQTQWRLECDITLGGKRLGSPRSSAGTWGRKKAGHGGPA